jgi:hypothetical protein
MKFIRFLELWALAPRMIASDCEFSERAETVDSISLIIGFRLSFGANWTRQAIHNTVLTALSGKGLLFMNPAPAPQK